MSLAEHESAKNSKVLFTADMLWRRAIDFLPLMLMLVLALGTFWLVKSMPQADTAAPSPVSSEPDYYMRDFEMRRYAETGKLQSQITGRYGDHFPYPDIWRIRAVKTYFIDEQGNTTKGSAKRAVSDRKGMNIELFEQVRVEHQPVAQPNQTVHPLIVFQSEYLKSTNRQEYISTDKPVIVTRGASTITGTGMQYTHGNRVVEVQGRAKAVIHPTIP